MALANFFQRAVTAASQVLQHFDSASFARELESHAVGLAFDASASESREGTVTLDLAVNLLSRLYPRLALVPLGRGLSTTRARLAAIARSINPYIEIGDEPSTDSPCLVVGTTRLKGRGRPVYVGSTGWVVELSATTPASSGNSPNPFGAAAVACLGAANVFRAIFGSSLSAGGLDSEVTLSLFDYKAGAKNPANPDLGLVDLGETHLVGVGAIGNAAVWALSRMNGLTGELHLIDDEPVDLGNLQRYVLTTQGSEGTQKTALAAKWLSKSGLAVHPHEVTWGAYLGKRADWSFERVAVALDSAEDRRAVQAALPKWIVNAWTQAGDLGVSRHSFTGDQACLMCLYLPDDKQPDLSQIVADAIGLSGEKKVVGQYLNTNAPLEMGFIERIAAAKAIEPAHLLQFVGKPLRAFYSEVVCGGAVLQFNARTGGATRMEVPLAFQSALAGVLLAGELICHAAGIKHAPPPTTTTFNLLAPLGPYFSHPRPKDRLGRCVCQDQDYLAAYHAKYGTEVRRARRVVPGR